MKRLPLTALFVLFAAGPAVHGDTALEPRTYHEDFETRELGAWAAYPHWEDTSYNEYFRVDAMVPGDPNLSVEQVVTPYSPVDCYAGAQKLLNMYLVPGSSVALRYYLKSHLPFASVTLRIAAGPDGSVDFVVDTPPTNRWVDLRATFADIVAQNPRLDGRDRIRVNAVAVLAKLPGGDPAMPFYFGLDDVVVKGMRATAFSFAEPRMHKLSEWKPYIPGKHYRRGDRFSLSGSWPLAADRVTLVITPFCDRTSIRRECTLGGGDGNWSIEPFTIDWDSQRRLGATRWRLRLSVRTSPKCSRTSPY